MINILLVEDDLTFATIVENFLTKNGYKVDVRHKIKTGLEAIKQNDYDLLLLDYRLPDGTGLDLVATLQQNNQPITAVMITSFNDVKTAVKAMHNGIFQYILKPVNPEELLMVIAEAINSEQKDVGNNKAIHFIKGSSNVSQKLAEHIALIAPTEMSVMIMGESGTGKEYVARSIHHSSKRSNQSFIAIDCGTLSKDLASSELFGHMRGAFTGALKDKKGLFETANGGTVFLDEIGNLGYDVQIKLLRMLQERVIQPVGSNKLVKIDIRLITATNENLTDSIAKGNFREDLYYRINEFKIQVPALREREDDLQLFITHFIELANIELDKKVKDITDEAKQLLMNYDWPGNLRELKNVLKRMVLLSKTAIAGKDVLPDEMVDLLYAKSNISSLKALKQNGEKELIIKTLRQTKYNKSKAAKLLNIDRKTLYHKIALYGIE